MAKPTRAELSLRITRVGILLLHGLSRAEIIQYLSEKTDWGVSVRTIDNYIARATVKIEEMSNVDLDWEKGKVKGRLEYLYKQNVSIQDYKAALAVVREEIALFGLAASQKLDITSDGKEIIFNVSGIDLEKDI